ncbi:MAG: DNA mismatch repair protein MutS [Alphaproteobacteria bacterium]|jgi:DNA mismatch repair protein MutS|nr:DNA mismatch repair protein MutS [Alphaproteobacteria bacterium]
MADSEDKDTLEQDKGIIDNLNDADYESLSPMMQQYYNIKKNHREYLLFFRMGDFFEMFFEDAVIIAKLLGLVLTKKMAGNGQMVSMCGVPVHSYEGYLNRIIKHGYNVALCDQMESPEEAKKRSSKELVRRDVVRIITPGTITEESLLEGDSYNYLAAIAQDNKKFALSWIDISSGDFYVESSSAEDINSLLYKIQPKEILLSNETEKSFLFDEFKLLTTGIAREKFESKACTAKLNQTFGSQSFVIETLEKLEKIACGVLLHYIELTQKHSLNISPPKKDSSSKYVRLDAFTRNSLEIEKSYGGTKQGSLKHTIDITKTSQGSRVLGNWLNNPLKDVSEINQRLEVVAYFHEYSEILNKIRAILAATGDVERALGRIMLKKATVIEVVILRSFLRNLKEIRGILFRKELPSLLSQIMEDFIPQNSLLNNLDEAIVEDIGAHNRESGFLKISFNAVFAEFLTRKDNFLQQIIALQEKYIVETAIANLKITYNNVDGYFIEVPIKQSPKILPEHNLVHKKNTTTTVRYSSAGLDALSFEIEQVDKLTMNLEKQIFSCLVEEIISAGESLRIASKSFAALDVLTSFAILALDYNLVRPLVDNSATFVIEGGRHLVVEKSIKKKDNSFFIPNSCIMENKNIFLITGPNMSGKSTYLRQNALFIILAQSGCFVPATAAHIGVCDAIFSRVGASDDLFKGQSTFMVEMLELATILNYATNKSFIILDEIGRGTSTYDGLSIAWATLEYINNKLQARTLFATHYHELIELEQKLNLLECYYVSVVEEKDKIIFMHSLLRGAVSKSYGIEVAKIAGLPLSVIKNSQIILNKLEKVEKDNLPLFDFTVETQAVESESPAVDYINSLEVDELTPKQALEVLYELKDLAKKI